MSTPSPLGYRLRVYAAGSGGEPLLAHEVPAHSWRDYLRLRIPGFDGSAVLDLSEVWAAFHASRSERHEGEATSRETIFKFGETRQITERCRVVIEKERAGPAGA